MCLGEASHGTHEFYAERAALSRKLVAECGFQAIVVEADWPDAWRVNRYIRSRSDDPDAAAALSGFERFPTWMWRNTVVRDLVEWLREHNRKLPPSRQVGFYGMDLYSLFSSIRAVLDHLDRTDPEAARRAPQARRLVVGYPAILPDSGWGCWPTLPRPTPRRPWRGRSCRPWSGSGASPTASI